MRLKCSDIGKQKEEILDLKIETEADALAVRRKLAEIEAITSKYGEYSIVYANNLKRITDCEIIKIILWVLLKVMICNFIDYGCIE